MSKVLVITTSLRAKSNSDRLAEKLIRGATAAGHKVDHISLKDKTIGFLQGLLCMSENATVCDPGRCCLDCRKGKRSEHAGLRDADLSL